MGEDGKREPAKSSPVDLKKRTRDFALAVIRLFAELPRRPEAQIIGRQLLRSATAVGANYREGLRARSRSEFAAKLNLGLMELEESVYWMELLEGSRLCDGTNLDWLKKEAGELTAIHVTCIKKARL